CQASEAGELPPQLYAENLGCLARTRVALAAATEVLGTVELARLPEALVAARSLPDAARCRVESEASTIAPPPVALARPVEEVANEIERARVLALATEPR